MLKLELVKEKKQKSGKIEAIYRLFRISEYTVEFSKYIYEDGEEETIIVRKDYNAEFLPEIYSNIGAFGSRKKEIKIQTSSYGALSPEDIQKVIKGYETALEVVAILTEVFIK